LGWRSAFSAAVNATPSETALAAAEVQRSARIMGWSQARRTKQKALEENLQRLAMRNYPGSDDLLHHDLVSARVQGSLNANALAFELFHFVLMIDVIGLSRIVLQNVLVSLLYDRTGEGLSSGSRSAVRRRSLRARLRSLTAGRGCGRVRRLRWRLARRSLRVRRRLRRGRVRRRRRLLRLPIRRRRWCVLCVQCATPANHGKCEGGKKRKSLNPCFHKNPPLASSAIRPHFLHAPCHEIASEAPYAD